MDVDALVEAVAIALSMADPDERPLPEGEETAPFYRVLARAALRVAVGPIYEDAADRQVAYVREMLEKRRDPSWVDADRSIRTRAVEVEQGLGGK